MERIAVVACEKVGGLSGLGLWPENVAFDAVDVAAGGSLETASAGQLGSRKSIRRT